MFTHKPRSSIPAYCWLTEASAAGSGYNVPALNTLVLYVGAAAGSVSSPLHAPAMDLYLRMVTEMDAEGRYLLLNAIANQLRYPNSHTHYFSCVLLSLFSEVKQEAVKEQVRGCDWGSVRCG